MPRTVENINPLKETAIGADSMTSNKARSVDMFTYDDKQSFASCRQVLHDELGVVEARRALKGYTRGLEISVLDRDDPESEIDQTRSLICRILETEMEDVGGIKFTEILKIELKKKKGDLIFKTVFFSSKASIAIDKSHLKALTTVGVGVTIC